MELESRAKELLGVSEYINIATASLDGEPWNTPVTGVHDPLLNFYWSSWKAAHHSKNIQENPRVFLTLYDSTRKRGDNHRRCLYIQAEAMELDNSDEILLAMSLLYGASGDRKPTDFLGEAQRRMYKAVPKSLWLNDVSERELTRETVKMRVEVSINTLKKLL